MKPEKNRRIRARGWGIGVAIAALLAGIVTPPGQAAAQLATQPINQSTTTARSAPDALKTAVPPTKITLITGDTVTYAQDAGGRVSVTVDPRPDLGRMTYRGTTENGRHYFVPDEVRPHITAGVLDKELFNLTALVADGYANDRAGQLPLIVQYKDKSTTAQLAARASTLPGEAASKALAPINAAAVRVGKKDTKAFWSSVFAATPGNARGYRLPGELGQGVQRVWLDGKVKALDEQSNHQIGAPAAWATGADGTGVTVGVIDTGIDTTHPDLAGKVVAARNFVPAGDAGGGDPADVTDRHGHGTHVASTVAGSGAASGKRHQGVAPAGKLIIAKALSDAGSGSDSTIIEAMQWQAEQRTRVVSMSLGGAPTDGLDPISQAVNNLSRQYGTLFVVAAGNSGPGPKTVSAPGAADLALTVGAVDSADQLADFSSRGPRLGDYAVKPEITAPGVGIIAARAAGTSMGTPVDEHHTAASGTSMATPHVAGAAALLAQQHPDWSGEQLKNALIGAAQDSSLTSFEEGAGRLDVARATSQKVWHDTPSISTTREPVTKQVTYRNSSASSVTLALQATLTRRDGTDAPAGMVTTSVPSVLVPPGGAASVDVTITPDADHVGVFTGHLVATGADGERLTVPLAARMGPPIHTLRIRVDADSLPNARPIGLGVGSALVLNDTDPGLDGEQATVASADWTVVGDRLWEVRLSVAAGTYAVSTNYIYADIHRAESDGHTQTYTLLRSQQQIDEDTTITFDLERDVVPVETKTARPAESVVRNDMWTQRTASGLLFYGGNIQVYPGGPRGQYYITPTQTPTIGSFRHLHDHTLIAPQISLSLRGRGRTDLVPTYLSESNSVPKFTADTTLQFAREADVRAGRSVRGKLVMMDPASAYHSAERQAEYYESIRRSIEAGAQGILTDSGLSVSITAMPELNKIPVLVVDGTDATRAREALGRDNGTRAVVHAQTIAPYEYKLTHYLPDRIPDRVRLDGDAKHVATVHTTYQGGYQQAQQPWGPAADVNESNHTFTAGQYFSFKASHAFVGGTSRTEYFSTPGHDVLWSRLYEFNEWPTGVARLITQDRTFAAPTVERERWNEVSIPGSVTGGPGLTSSTPGYYSACDSCRQGDRLRLRSLTSLGLGQFFDAADSSHRVYDDGLLEEGRLFRGTTEIAPKYDDLGIPYYELGAAPARYRYSARTRSTSKMHGVGTVVDTDWTFRSERPRRSTVEAPDNCIDGVLFGDKNPCDWQALLHLRYDLQLTAEGTAAAGRPHTVTVTGQRSGAPTKSQPVPLTHLKVWISAGGKKWTAARVTPGPGHSYRVRLVNPSKVGPVSLKVEASDRHGNTIRQVVTDAYAVS
ncbi:S8 family serine peptidase [Kribbella sp. NPDC048915]|uniref:S8 family serine peptidase n=1 Tax=Kribbella sp. NPDC048915 TaxID=3155148 RepID=UPI0033DD613E